MMSSSLRRVTRVCPSTCSISCRSPSPSIAASSQRFTPSPGHQRRHSSSKPPVPPNDGSRGVDSPAQGSVKTMKGNASKDAALKRAGAESRLAKRKGKEAVENNSETPMNIPSVPSTQHLSPKGMLALTHLTETSSHRIDIHVASFFSVHRPMSVTTSVPANLTQEAFQTIFTPRTPSNNPNPSDVIYTISRFKNNLNSMVNALEAQQQQDQSHQPASQHQADNELVEAITQASVSNADPSRQNQPRTHHLDGQPPQNVEISISIDEFVKQCRPFNTPPAPVPMSGDEAAASMREATLQYPPEVRNEVESEQSHSSYSTVLTIHESTGPNGQKTYSAHSTPLQRIEEEYILDDIEAPSTPTSRRTRIRDGRRMRHSGIPAQRRGGKMFMISVKRQRRLKMKKHKYKKLMKKTRNLRRRLEKD